MATDVRKKKFLHQERERITRYKHQHRGLDFLKVWLPPETNRKVNIIGADNHIYKGKIPVFPIDQLPPEVDPKSINEEELFKEIRDIRFPEVPPLQPLGPRRRIGGAFTKAKRLTFAPVQINLDDGETETPILGADGKIYKGRSKAVPVHELDEKLRGTKRAIKTPASFASSRGTVKPTLVSLYVDGKPLSERTRPAPVIQLPYADLNKLIKYMEMSSPEQKKYEISYCEEKAPPTEEAKEESEHTEEESVGEVASTESVETSGEVTETTTSITEDSTEVTSTISEEEETDVAEEETDVAEEETDVAEEETDSEPDEGV